MRAPLRWRLDHSQPALLAVGLLVVVLLGFTSHAASADAIGMKTRFDYVAKFPIGSTPGQIESWRAQVLGRAQQQPCVGGRPCIARMVRLALDGSGERDVIAFDLMREVSPAERAAVAAAALAALPGTALYVGMRPADVDSVDVPPEEVHPK